MNSEKGYKGGPVASAQNAIAWLQGSGAGKQLVVNWGLLVCYDTVYNLITDKYVDCFHHSASQILE